MEATDAEVEADFASGAAGAGDVDFSAGFASDLTGVC